MSKTVLQIVQEFAARTGIGSPTTAVANTSPQVLQIVALLNEEAEDIVARRIWQLLIREASITTIAAEDQGALDTIIGASFDSILHNTIWDVDEQLPIFGPQSAPQWQAQLALQAASPRYSFRIRQNHLYLYPAPSAGKNLRLEYMTKYPILDGDGSTLKVWITADTDTFIFPDALVMAGLRWRWKREKGLTYAEDKDRYNAMFSSLAEREVPKETISLESLDRNAQPGILVPYGNWSIP